MYLTRLIYYSQYEHVDEEGIERITKEASAHNKENGITGALFAENGYFFQCLEGGRSAVNQTYNRIIEDERHFHCTLLSFKEIDERIFPEWDMGHIPRNNLDYLAYFRYGTGHDFQPDQLSLASAEAMLKSIAQHKYTL